MPDDQVIYEETKLFKLLILVPLSTANVEHEFSVLRMGNKIVYQYFNTKHKPINAFSSTK